MPKILLIPVLFLIALTVNAQQVKVIEYPELEKAFKSQGDTVVIYNFWATWCAPCVKELPHFRSLSEKMEGNKLKFVYVSLDFENKKDRATEMLKKQGITGLHYLLKGDANEWINKLDPEWQGDIPYTLMVKPGGNKVKAAHAFESENELKEFIDKNL